MCWKGGSHQTFGAIVGGLLIETTTRNCLRGLKVATSHSSVLLKLTRYRRSPALSNEGRQVFPIRSIFVARSR